MSSAKLTQAPSKAEIEMGDVIVIRNGYDVWHHGDAYGRQGNTSSMVRSYLTTLYGIAIREGVISGGRNAVERRVNSLDSATAKTFDNSVKIKHLVSYTSCGNPPGSKWNYNCNFNKMCEILMELYDGHWSENGMVDLCDAKLKSVLGGSWYPKYWTKEQHNSTSYFRIYGNPSGMAHWGYLWLHRGEWKGKQLVDPWFVDHTIQPMPKPNANGYANENEGWQIHLNKTGVWKGLPGDCYAAMGACDRSSILVCPSLNLVIARKGPTSSPYSDRCVDSPQRWAKPIFDAINDKVSLLTLTGSNLPEGEFEVGQDEFGKIVRINLNTIKEWSKVPGIKKRWKVTGPNGESHADNALISDIKDVDGDGKLDLFRVSNSVLMRFDENNNRIWRSKQLNPPADDESRMPVVDLDRDGKYECVISMTDKMYCIDAATGNIKWEVTTGAEKNYSSLVVGHFDRKNTYGIALRVKKKVLFFDCHGKSLRTCTFSASDTYGHCMGHADINSDGYDEVFAVLNGKTFAVSHNSKMLWEDNSQRNHSDWICVGDVDNDGEMEFLYDHDGCYAARGPIYVVNSMTGKREQSWPYSWPSSMDSNGAVIGDFRPDLPGLELARVDKRNRIELRDSTGRVIWDKSHASTGCSSGDWDGDGVLDILVGAAGHAGGPHFSVWNGYGKRLYAIQWLPTPEGRSFGSICGPERTCRVCPDLDGNGRADVLVAFGKWYTGTDQVLCLMEAPENWP
jgi:outer membrane protein assembly factor BamB